MLIEILTHPETHQYSKPKKARASNERRIIVSSFFIRKQGAYVMGVVDQQHLHSCHGPMPVNSFDLPLTK